MIQIDDLNLAYDLNSQLDEVPRESASYEEALLRLTQYLETPLSPAERARSFSLLGSLLRIMGRFDESLQFLKAANLTLSRGDYEIRPVLTAKLELALTLQRLNHLKESAGLIEEALKQSETLALTPDLRQLIYFTAARNEFARGHYKKAIQYFERAQEMQSVRTADIQRLVPVAIATTLARINLGHTTSQSHHPHALTFYFFPSPRKLNNWLVGSLVSLIFFLGPLVSKGDFYLPLLVVTLFFGAFSMYYFLQRQKFEISSAPNLLRISQSWPRQKILVETEWDPLWSIEPAWAERVIRLRGSDPHSDRSYNILIPFRSQTRAHQVSESIRRVLNPDAPLTDEMYAQSLIHSNRNSPGLMALIGANILVFILSLMWKGQLLEAGWLTRESFLNGEVWRVVTSMFLHGGFLHLWMNMMALYSLGVPLIALIGTRKTMIIYFVSGLAAGLWALLWLQDDQPLVGASGAIFGLFGSIFAISVFSKRFHLARGLKFNQSALIRALVLNLIISLLPSISLAAHVAGFIVGLVLAYFIVPTKAQDT